MFNIFINAKKFHAEQLAVSTICMYYLKLHKIDFFKNVNLEIEIDPFVLEETRITNHSNSISVIVYKKYLNENSASEKVFQFLIEAVISFVEKFKVLVNDEKKSSFDHFIGFLSYTNNFDFSLIKKSTSKLGSFGEVRIKVTNRSVIVYCLFKLKSGIEIKIPIQETYPVSLYFKKVYNKSLWKDELFVIEDVDREIFTIVYPHENKWEYVFFPKQTELIFLQSFIKAIDYNTSEEDRNILLSGKN